jgi:hypothetical protein
MSRGRKKADKADLARQAVKYLEEHDLVLKWDFPLDAPPPAEIRRLIMPYFSDGEIERTTSGFLCDYLIERLDEDFLADGQAPAPWSRRPPECRIVCYTGDDE